MQTSEFVQPRWAQEVSRYSSVKPQFVLWGNIYDIYPIMMGETVTTLPLLPYLTRVLCAEGYDMVLNFEPLFGFTLLAGSAEDFKNMAGVEIDSDEQKHSTLLKSVEILEKIYSQKEKLVAVLVSFGSRLNDSCPQEKNEFFYRTFRLAVSSNPFVPKTANGNPTARHSLLLWILDKENDIPAWYSLDNPRIHVLSIPKPDHSVRRYVINACSRGMPAYSSIAPAEQEEKKNLFLDQTGGMYASEIISITQIARKENIQFPQIAEAIRRYKIGIVDNPWAKISPETLASAEAMLSARVIGQDRAVRHSADILKRSLFNLSGAQFSKLSQKPKGVLFLAGPTGVGKTELAKSITELIFGTPTNYIRFDMSEFSHEHADQRLLGSPPGYVGYDVGGQLTNAIKEKPFSLVLFDEIEKGHPKILDIFLQILDDGRLTSGRGETVYFSEALIVFTSNLGMFEIGQDGSRDQRVQPEMEYESIQSAIMESIDHYFKSTIGRPEILNRIGNNIIVFDFIRKEIAEKIFDKMLGNIIYKLQDEHKINLTFLPQCLQTVRDRCCSDLSMGGRGIGNAMEENLINPLSRALFAANAQAGAYKVTAIDADVSPVNIVIEPGTA